MDIENDVFRWLPCPVVFVGTAYGGRRDIMTATAMFVSEKEPLLVISVATGHLTADLIEKSGSFVLSIAGEDQKKLAIQLGSAKGDGRDKMDRFGIEEIKVAGLDAPIPQGVASWMQCRVESTHEINHYRVVTGRVVESGDLDKPPLIWHSDGFFALDQR